MGSSVKWATAESGSLRVAEEARDVLVNVDNGQPLGIVTVVGNARQGKSFLMNALTDSDTAFRVSPEVRPCTAGADLSPHLMPLSKFTSLGRNDLRVPRVISSSEPMIGFVDMEGQGDRSPERDVRLATPFLLISQVVIFNWMGLPNKDTILQKLVVMIMAAEKVMDRQDEGESTFGHLVLLVRDVKGRAAEIEALVMDNEDTRGLSVDEGRDAHERNTIREGLRNAFKSITVHTMHRPHPEISDGAVPLTEVSSGFTTCLNELRVIIAGHLSTPHNFGGQPIIGGERVHDIVRGLCDAVNSTEDICPPSVLEAIDTRRAHEETQKALGRFESKLEYVQSGPARPTQEVATAIDNARKMAFELFDQATQGLSSRIRKEARADLMQQILLKSKIILGNQEGKRRELANKLQALVSKSEADVTTTALQWNTTNAQGMNPTDLLRQWDGLVSTKYRTLDLGIKKMAAVNSITNMALLTELGWALSREQFDGLLMGTYQQVDSLNRTALAREADRKAKEEAERRAAELRQENARLERERRQAQAQTRAAEERERRAERAREPEHNPYADWYRAMMMRQMMGGMYGGYFYR